jgi:signal transduction histidine kinase
MRLPRLTNNSIATRLFLTAAASSFLVLLIASLFFTTFYRRETEEVFERRLEVYLRAIVADVAQSGEEGSTDPGRLGEPQFELPGSGWYWQITRMDGAATEIKASRSLFANRLPKLADRGVAAEVGGFRRGFVEDPDGRRVRIIERVIDVGDSGVYLVQVAASVEEMEQQIERFYFALMIAFTMLAIALAIVAMFQVRFGLRPLRRLQAELVAIRRGEDERIGGAYPSEIAPLAEELNLLIGVNRDILERARTQVGNLAHALKTPLSVIVNEAYSSPSPLADKVSEQATVMREQIGFYLDRARAAARGGAIGSVTQVAPCLDSLLRAFRKIYAERGVVFTGEMQPDIRFLGERQDLEEMIGNLLDNAGKWATHEVVIAIVAETPASAEMRPFLHITIDDDGPGLTPEQIREATKRGRRLDETKPGSGLGLSIVADLAAAYGGALELEKNAAGGLRARLRVPGF